MLKKDNVMKKLIVILLLLACCHSQKVDDRRKIADFLSYVKEHKIDTTGRSVDTTIFIQNFFGDEIHRKKDTRGLQVLVLLNIQPFLENSDSITVEDNDLRLNGPLDKGEYVYKAIFLRNGVRNDSIYFLVDSQGIESFSAIRKGDVIAGWW